MGADKLFAYWEKRENAIEQELDDPYTHGVQLPQWELVDEQLKDFSEVLLQGGNRSSKSEFCARRVVECLVQNPGTNIWCITANHQNSINHQQSLVYKYIPKEFKKLGRGKVGYLTFSYKNGFTNSSFILPNRSTCTFRVWSSDIESVEGGEIGVPQDPVEGTHNLALWADEQIPLNWVQALRWRCVTRADSRGIPARMLLSFTTVDGWTPCVASYLSGARTLIEKPAELLDGEMAPILQQSVRKCARIVYFWTEQNPYNSWEASKSQLAGASKDEIRTRAYGICVKPSNTCFPNLDSAVIKPHDEIPIIKDPEKNPAIWVLSIDPAGRKPFFMVLCGIDQHGVHYIVDEYPSPEIGPWADLEKGNNASGDAGKPNGFGIGDYCDIIRKMIEGKENVEIIIDPRLGQAQFLKAEGTSDILSEMAEEGISAYPAPGLDVETGLQSINTLLAYDKSKPIDFDNHPKLIFSDRCGNTITCMSNYSVDLGHKSVFKDPTDCVRYIAVSNFKYYEEADLEVTGIGGY